MAVELGIPSLLFWLSLEHSLRPKAPGARHAFPSFTFTGYAQRGLSVRRRPAHAWAFRLLLLLAIHKAVAESQGVPLTDALLSCPNCFQYARSIRGLRRALQCS